MKKQAKSVLNWEQKCLEENVFPREDYRELVELTVVFLGGRVPRGFHLRKAGAHHTARFMAYAIYALKIEMMSERFPLSQEERRKIHRLAKFVAVIHSPAYLRSRIAATAPSVDVKYLSALKEYDEEDLEVAQTAIKSVFKHLWYLTEELVVLALFDENLSDNIRKAMIDRLLEFPRQQTFPPKKITFPISVFQDQDPIDFGQRSWLLFSLLDKKEEQLDWMFAPVNCWDKMSGYKKIAAVVNSLEVVNDCAERVVKLTSDFINVTKDPVQLESVLQVTERYRNKIPKITKSNINNLFEK